MIFIASSPDFACSNAFWESINEYLCVINDLTSTFPDDIKSNAFFVSMSDAAYVVNIGAAVGSQTPSDGSVDHTAISASFNGMYLNLATVTSTVTVAASQNAFLAGPVNFTNTVTVEGTLTVI